MQLAIRYLPVNLNRFALSSIEGFHKQYRSINYYLTGWTESLEVA